MAEEGRPTKFTPQVREKILAALKEFLPITLAAECARIDRKSIYNWMETGKEDIAKNIDSEYAEFFHNIKQIRAKNAIFLMQDVMGREKNWQAIAWILERTFREDFGDKAAEIEIRERLDQLEAKNCST
jgi:uncharacterized membrane protein YheB (UPF0754 family)